MNDFLNLCQAYGVLTRGSVQQNGVNNPLPLGGNGHNGRNVRNGHPENEPEPSDDEKAEAQQGALPLEKTDDQETEARF